MYSESISPGKKKKFWNVLLASCTEDISDSSEKQISVNVPFSHLLKMFAVSLKCKRKPFWKWFYFKSCFSFLQIMRTHILSGINSRRFIFQELHKRIWEIIKLLIYWSGRNQEKDALLWLFAEWKQGKKNFCAESTVWACLFILLLRLYNKVTQSHTMDTSWGDIHHLHSVILND